MKKTVITKRMRDLEAAAASLTDEMLARARPVLRAQAAELAAGTCSETLKIMAADLNDLMARKDAELEALRAAWADEKAKANAPADRRHRRTGGTGGPAAPAV